MSHRKVRHVHARDDEWIRVHRAGNPPQKAKPTASGGGIGGMIAGLMVAAFALLVVGSLAVALFQLVAPLLPLLALLLPVYLILMLFGN